MKTSYRGLTELNITPLLDLVFVLLVIFIIATPQLMNSLEMSLPSNQAKVQSLTPEPLRVLVLGKGRIQINAREFNLDELKAELANRRAKTPQLTVIVQTSADAEYQALVDVLEVISQAGISHVGLTLS